MKKDGQTHGCYSGAATILIHTLTMQVGLHLSLLKGGYSAFDNCTRGVQVRVTNQIYPPGKPLTPGTKYLTKYCLNVCKC